MQSYAHNTALQRSTRYVLWLLTHLCKIREKVHHFCVTQTQKQLMY